MDREEEELATTDNSSTVPKDQPKTTKNQANGYYFQVHCLSETRNLEAKTYDSIDEIKNAAYALYIDGAFNDDNAILTYIDDENVEVLLTTVPKLPKKGHSKHFFIRFVYPVCAMCSNPFGIVDDQLLLQCSRRTCGVQYCKNCVQSIQGVYSEYPFICIACKKKVTPQRNILIEKHIIWKSMCQLYGVQSLLDLKKTSEVVSCYPILQNIRIREVHLKSQLNTLKCRLNSPNNQIRKEDTRGLFDQELINNVEYLCENLQKLAERIERTDRESKRRAVTVKSCLEKYKKGMKEFDLFCDTLIKNIEKFGDNHNGITSHASDAHKQHIRELYRMNDLDKLLSEQSSSITDDVFEDITFRRKFLCSCLETITSLFLGDRSDQTNLLQNDLTQVKGKLSIIYTAEEEVQYLRDNQKSIKRYIDEYDRLLRHDQLQDIPCSKFIVLLERMRVCIDQLQISENLPKTIQLMENWQSDYGADKEFKPKVIDLVKTIELDVQQLFTDYNWTYSIPYKVGVIGDGSAGKTALGIKLSGMAEFSSMIAAERSTYGYLQFDSVIYKDPYNNKTIPITFVDIEGATDSNKTESTGNYIQLINKADCDVYVIVFDKRFSEHNDVCRKHIENILGRKCLLVRSKADLLFKQFFRQRTNTSYTKDNSVEYEVEDVLDITRNEGLATFADQRLTDTVYLTAAVCEENLNGASFAEFDLNELKEKLIEFAMTDFRGPRICNLATRAAITVINTCFRRGYTVTQTKYKWFAAGASLVPFLNELPAFFGREKIRQAFGIHDNSAVTNLVRQTTDSFEQYLVDKKLTVPKETLTSGEFDYLLVETTIDTTTRTSLELRPDMYYHQKLFSMDKNQSSSIKKPRSRINGVVASFARAAPTICSVVSTFADNAVRVVAPAARLTVQTFSVATIVVSMALTPVFAAWSFYSAGNGMNKELHSICDDLVVILQYFVVDRCNDYCQNL